MGSGVSQPKLTVAKKLTAKTRSSIMAVSAISALPALRSELASGGRQSLVKDHTAQGHPTQPGDALVAVREHTKIRDLYTGVPDEGGGGKARMIGAGGTANVFVVTNKATGRQYACKVVNLATVKDPAVREMLVREIGIVKQLDHPNCIKITEVFAEGSTIYILMELCLGGELFDRLYDQVPEPRFSEPDARVLLGKMLRALNYLHINGIVHRDLKLENFLFTGKEPDAEIKLIDFGFAQYFKGSAEHMHQQVGTCYYVAPEVLKCDYTERSDLWSMGVIAYAMLTGLTPFGGEDSKSIMQAVADGCSNPDALIDRMQAELEEADLHEDCIDFVLALLTVDPDKRLTAEQALRHQWLIADKCPQRERLQASLRRASATTQGNVFENMKAFKQKSALQRSAMMAVSFGLGAAELKQLGDAFVEADKNGDGVISLVEFREMMKQQGMYDNTDITAIFDSIDQDHAGALQYSEFLSAAINQQQQQDDAAMEEAFYRLDLDDTGFLDACDLKIMMPGHSDGQITRLIDNVDGGSKDGKIDLAEFKKAMAQTRTVAWG